MSYLYVKSFSNLFIIFFVISNTSKLFLQHILRQKWLGDKRHSLLPVITLNLFCKTLSFQQIFPAYKTYWNTVKAKWFRFLEAYYHQLMFCKIFAKKNVLWSKGTFAKKTQFSKTCLRKTCAWSVANTFVSQILWEVSNWDICSLKIARSFAYSSGSSIILIYPKFWEKVQKFLSHRFLS